MVAIAKNRRIAKIHLEIISSENGAQTIVKWALVVPFQNCVW
jgi:hypothetical protein